MRIQRALAAVCNSTRHLLYHLARIRLLGTRTYNTEESRFTGPEAQNPLMRPFRGWSVGPLLFTALDSQIHLLFLLEQSIIHKSLNWHEYAVYWRVIIFNSLRCFLQASTSTAPLRMSFQKPSLDGAKYDTTSRFHYTEPLLHLHNCRVSPFFKCYAIWDPMPVEHAVHNPNVVAEADQQERQPYLDYSFLLLMKH